jgi:hypothetical protein
LAKKLRKGGMQYPYMAEYPDSLYALSNSFLAVDWDDTEELLYTQILSTSLKVTLLKQRYFLTKILFKL